MAEFAWRIVFDDHQEMVIYADDLYDVLSFIQSNQTPLFGHDGVAHLNIQINKLTEDEISDHYSLGLVDEVQEYDNGGENPFQQGFWLPQPGETIPDEVRTETAGEGITGEQLNKMNLNYRDRTPESYQKDEPFLPTLDEVVNWINQSNHY